MADSYADYALSTGLNDGTDWANAYHTTTPTQNALTDAGAGGNVYIKTDSAGTNQDIVSSGSITITSPGTFGNPTNVYGCKNGTTNEPPVNADLTSRGDTDIPVYGLSHANGILTLAGSANVFGMEFTVADDYTTDSNSRECWIFENSTFRLADAGGVNKMIRLGSTGAAKRSFKLWLRDCELDFGAATAHIETLPASQFIMYDGIVTAGSGVTKLFDAVINGYGELRGVDLTALGANTILDVASANGQDILIANCKVNASLSLVTGTWQDMNSRVRMHACSAATGLTTGNSVRDLEEATYFGDIIHNTLIWRTGGASDGASGNFSIAMTPNADVTNEPFNALISTPIIGFVEGDGASKTATIYIANSAVSTDYNDDGVYAVFFYPDEAGTAQHEYNINDRMVPLGSAVVQTVDTDSTWETGGNSPQKLSASISPDYSGPIIGFVFVTRRQASPDTVYVDPLMEIV